MVDWKDLAQNENAWRILIKNESTLPCKQNRMYSIYEKNPHTAIGRQVEKLFRGKYFMEVVIDTDFDTDTNETIWAVRCDDGDVEDLNAKELAAVLHDDGAGITTHNANSGQSKSLHPMTTRRSEKGQSEDRFHSNPHLAVGLSTQKWFGGALYFGKVTDTDIDAANGQKIWRVVCSDGDTFDYNILELRKILISELS